MPRVKGYTIQQKTEYQRRLLAERCETMLRVANISKSKVARFCGVSPQAVCLQFKTDSITTPVLMAVITMTDAPADKVKEMLTVSQ